MLKQWYVPTETGYLVDISVDSHEDDIPAWKENDGESTQFQIADRLSNAEKAQLLDLFVEFKDIFQNKPGLTTMAEHRIYTGDAVPVRLPPYRIAHAYRSAVKEEIEQMLAEGIIEPLFKCLQLTNHSSPQERSSTETVCGLSQVEQVYTSRCLPHA